MKITKQLFISLVLVLSACTPAPAKSPVEAMTAPEATPTALQTSPQVTTTSTTRDQPDEPDERVEFEPGITSTKRSGAIIEGGSKEYVLSGAAGQSLNIRMVGYDAPVEFTLSGPGGIAWSGEPGASDVYIFAVQVVLPEDGDYAVRLSVPSEAGDTRYDVIFSMITNPQATVPMSTESPERVEFASGAFSAHWSSLLPSGLGVKQYVLAARDGQTLTVDITSVDVPISFTITSPSGIQLFTEVSQASPTNGGYSAGYSFFLSETGDYLVTLTKAEHTPSTRYTVDLTIR